MNKHLREVLVAIRKYKIKVPVASAHEIAFDGASSRIPDETLKQFQKVLSKDFRALPEKKQRSLLTRAQNLSDLLIERTNKKLQFWLDYQLANTVAKNPLGVSSYAIICNTLANIAAENGSIEIIVAQSFIKKIAKLTFDKDLGATTIMNCLDRLEKVGRIKIISKGTPHSKGFRSRDFTKIGFIFPEGTPEDEPIKEQDEEDFDNDDDSSSEEPEEKVTSCETCKIDSSMFSVFFNPLYTTQAKQVTEDYGRVTTVCLTVFHLRRLDYIRSVIRAKEELAEEARIKRQLWWRRRLEHARDLADRIFNPVTREFDLALA